MIRYLLPSGACLRASLACATLAFCHHALAQTKPQIWTTNRTGATQYSSQQAALVAVRSLGGSYAFADKVQTVIPTVGQTTYVYEATPRAPDLGEWGSYSGWLNSPYPTETAAVAALQASGYTAPGCPSPVVVPATGWSTSRYWNLSQYPDQESRTYHLKYYWASSPCQLGTREHVLTRTRSVICPVGLTWNGYGDTPDFQTCIKRDIARVSAVPMPCSSCDDLQHNPVSVSTGDKFQAEIDFALPWLSFSRYYHSSHSVPSGKIGTGWSHNLNMRLYRNGWDYAGVLMPRGDILPFARVNGIFEGTDGSGVRLLDLGSLRFKLTTPERTVAFDTSGRAELIEYPSGQTLTLAYDAYDRLAMVTHSSGRSIVFEYATGPFAINASIARIKTNGAVLVSYDYDAQGRLEFARYPNGTAKRYHYENASYPTHLTGISDESDSRFATYGYNADGYATLSEHAGGLYSGSFDYLPDGTTTYTDANGRVQTFSFSTEGAYRKTTQMTDAAGSESTTYLPTSTDFRRRPASRTDKRGIQTTYSYADINDALGTLRRITTNQAVGTLQTRTTQTDWRFPPLLPDERRSYDANGNLIRKEVWTRNARGQVMTHSARDF